MAGYPHIRYISSGLDGTSFRGPFRGNFEVCNKINEYVCCSMFNAERGYIHYYTQLCRTATVTGNHKAVKYVIF